MSEGNWFFFLLEVRAPCFKLKYCFLTNKLNSGFWEGNLKLKIKCYKVFKSIRYMFFSLLVLRIPVTPFYHLWKSCQVALLKVKKKALSKKDNFFKNALKIDDWCILFFIFEGGLCFEKIVFLSKWETANLAISGSLSLKKKKKNMSWLASWSRISLIFFKLAGRPYCLDSNRKLHFLQIYVFYEENKKEYIYRYAGIWHKWWFKTSKNHWIQNELY